MSVTIAKLIPIDTRCLTTVIDHKAYYGSEHFILRKDLCSNTLIKRVDKLFLREIQENSFRSNKEGKYVEVQAVEFMETYLTLNSGINKANISCLFYEYFKNLGYELKIGVNHHNPIGIFKDNEWVGMVLQIRVIKAGGTK